MLDSILNKKFEADISMKMTNSNSFSVARICLVSNALRQAESIWITGVLRSNIISGLISASYKTNFARSTLVINDFSHGSKMSALNIKSTVHFNFPEWQCLV